MAQKVELAQLKDTELHNLSLSKINLWFNSGFQVLYDMQEVRIAGENSVTLPG